MKPSSLSSQYIAVVIIYILAYLYSIHFAVNISQNPSFSNVNAVHESCFLGCSDWNRAATAYRGRNYYIGSGKSASDCFATFWSVSHFALYTTIGFIAPDLFWETFGAGLLFELYEKQIFDCHDALDLAFNSAGFLAGKTIRTSLNFTI